MRHSKLLLAFAALLSGAACSGSDEINTTAQCLCEVPAPTGPLHFVVEGVMDAWMPVDAGSLSFKIRDGKPPYAGLEIAPGETRLNVFWMPSMTTHEMSKDEIDLIQFGLAENEYPVTFTSGSASSTEIHFTGTAAVDGKTVGISVDGPMDATCSGTTTPVPPGASFSIDARADPARWFEPKFEGPCAPFK